MQTLWQYFRISLALAAASGAFGVLAILGLDELERRKPPDAIALETIAPAWKDYRFSIRAAGPYRFDLEMETRDTTPARLCDPAPPVTAYDCHVPAGRVDIEWRIENEQRSLIASGNLGLSASQLYFGSFHWLELGRVEMNPGKHVMRLRRAAAAKARDLDLPWSRLRIWRGARDGAEASEEARRTSNWVFATVCTLFLTLFAVMLEYVVWKRQRAPR